MLGTVTRLTLATACVFCALAASHPFLQAQEFDVASVKPNKSGELRASIGTQPGGRVLATNMPTKDLVSFAYQVQLYQVVDAPDWTIAERFDVTATAPAGTAIVAAMPDGGPGTMQLMMRRLLADRFGLVVHKETRQLPIYNLLRAREDALGSQLQRSSADCTASSQPPATAQRPACGMRLGPGVMEAGSRSMTQLANTLAQFVQRPVRNETRLDGLFDFSLKWQYEPLAGPTATGRVTPFDPNMPDLYTALQEQLGLKLDRARGPVDVVVVDRISRPSPD